MTLIDLRRELGHIVERARIAEIDTGEIVGALQAELDAVEVDAGESVKSDLARQ